MPRTNQSRKRRQQPKRERHISVRSIQRDKPDVHKLARAVIALAMAQAEAEAAAQADGVQAREQLDAEGSDD